MARELNDALERLTRKATLVVVLEDLHWSDVATVDLLTSIAQRPEAARLLIVGTYRPADAVVSAPALGKAIRELEGRGLCEHLDLELLTRRDVGEYTATRLGGMYSEDAADHVFQRSGGNALFMVNVLDHLVQAGAIRKLDGRWSVDGAAEALSQVPEGLRPFIRRRLDTLSAEERRTLETASVVGVDKQELARLDPVLEALTGRTRLIEECGVTEWPDGIISARYRFRHAIYREILYQEVPEARRVRLHRRIGEHIMAAYGHESASLAAVLAVHFENGRDAERASRYRRMAGERALGLHAYHEAAQHLEKALEAFDQAGSRPADGDPEDRVRWELEVCTTLGTTSRARLLVDRLDDSAIQLPVLFNLWSHSNTAADHAESTNLVTLMSELAAATENDELAMMYSSAFARTQFNLGDLAGCAEHMRRILTPYEPRRLADVHGRYGHVDHATDCLGYNARLLWLQGCPDQALAQMREARKLAKHLDNAYSDAVAGYLALPTLQVCGDTAQLDRQASDLKRLSAEQGYALWLAWATCFEGWVAGARGNLTEGIALMEHGVEAFRGTGTRAHLPYLLALLSETCLRAGRIDAASERLAEAHAQAESSDERYWEAELHRLDGEVLLVAADNGNPDNGSSDRAEACFHGALEVARRQQARSLELRAALSLSRLWSPSRSDEARHVLGGVLETFSEGHDTADLRAASEAFPRRLSRH
jgi:predicted ATPase